MNEQTNKFDERPRPTLDELVTVFELLDTDKQGRITRDNIVRCLKTIQKLKEHSFELETYLETLSGIGEDGFLNQ